MNYWIERIGFGCRGDRIGGMVVAMMMLLAAFAHGANTPDVDGIALSIQSREGQKGEELRAYRLEGGVPAGHAVIYESEDRIESACINPFGTAAAFVAPGGTVMVVDIDGENARELADDALWVQWPAGDGGEWIYFIDAGDKSTLRRVHAERGEVETVVAFDRTVELAAMSPDASDGTGWLVLRAGDGSSYAGVYPMSRGTGHTWSIPQWWQFSTPPGQRLSVAPDGTVFSMLGPDGTLLLIEMPAFDNNPAAYRLDPMNYRNRPRDWYRTMDWQFSHIADPHSLQRAVRIEDELNLKQARFADPVFAVNPPGWLAVTQQNFAGEDRYERDAKPNSSDMVLWDAVHMAHHGIPSHVTITSNQAGTFDRAVGFWQKLPAEYSLGQFNGKAPFTVKFDDPRITEEMTWDFGDGSERVTGRTAEHTYQAPGRYTISVEKEPWAKRLRLHHEEGPGLFFGRVEVTDGSAPTAEAQYVDSRHVVVEFDQRVQAGDGTQVSMGGGVGVENWELADSGRRLNIKLDGDLTENDVVQLSGFMDMAQTPNEVSANVEVRRPAWPTDPNKLVFWWEDAGKSRFIVTPQGEIRRSELFRDGPPSGFDKLGRMALGLGGMRANPRTSTRMGQGDLAEIVLGNTFSFECTFQSNDLAQQEMRRPPRIVSLGSHRPFVSLFMIGQQTDRLMVSIKTIDNWIEDMGPPHGYMPIAPEERDGGRTHPYGHGPWVEVAKLPDTRSHHMVVTYQPGNMVVYLDGEQVYQTDRVTGDLDWGFGVLMFGSHHGLSGGSDQWSGTVEGVGFYSRVLSADEVRRNAEAYAEKMNTRDERMRDASNNEVSR